MFKSKFNEKEIKIPTESFRASRPQFNICQEEIRTQAPPTIPVAWVSEIQRAREPWQKYRSNWIKWDCFPNSNHPSCKSPYRKLTEGRNQLKNKLKLSHKVLTKSKFIFMRKTLTFYSFWSKTRRSSKLKRTREIKRSISLLTRTSIQRRKKKFEDTQMDSKFLIKIRKSMKYKKNLISLKSFRKES